MRFHHVLAILLLCGFPAVSAAQVPFFFPGSIGYEPVISTISSGPFLTPQAIISADQKYVTININTGNDGLIALQPFSFATLPNGYVGQTTPAGAAGLAAARKQAAKPHKPTILDQKGMTYIAPLTN